MFFDNSGRCKVITLLTEGIKIVFGVGPSSTNKTYQTARELLKARLARMEPEKYKMTPEQEAFRKEIGLSNR